MTALVERSGSVERSARASVVASLSPLVYGYMRVPCDVADEKVRRMEHELRRFARERGFCFGAIFYEFVCGSFDALEELSQELQRADAHDVIMPSYRHLARSRLLQNSLIARLEFDANAKVHVLVDTNV